MDQDAQKPTISPETSTLVNDMATNQSPLIKHSSMRVIKKGRALIVSLVFLVVFAGGSLAYYLWDQYQSGPKTSHLQSELANQNQLDKNHPADSNPNSLPHNKTQATLFSGQLSRLDKNLKLFSRSKSDKLNGIPSDFAYYSAGIFTQGELKGYTRIIATRSSGGPAPPLTFMLATKNFTEYYLHDPLDKTTQYPENDWHNPYSYLDKSKITATKNFKTEQPLEITLSSTFSLYFEKYPTEFATTKKTDVHDQQITESILKTNFSNYRQLNSPHPHLKMYAAPYNYYDNEADIANWPQKQQVEYKTKKKYFRDLTQVIVVDSSNLPMTYSLTTSENVRRYQSELANYRAQWNHYQKEFKKFKDKKIAEYPEYPDQVYNPTLGFKDSMLEAQGDFYTNYQTAIPNGCATTLVSRVMNVDETELKQIGVVGEINVYKLKNYNHPLNQLAFNNKIEGYDQTPEEVWGQVNPNADKPNYQQYMQKNPLLFVQDYWSRWVALGEYDINLPGGCGKPVVYLYPQRPTEVKVKFLTPVQLTTHVPTYSNSWQVWARPNGQLKNLRPELTDCAELDTTQAGLEYAYQACQNNSYPYIFWAGNVMAAKYPIVKKGWVINQNGVSHFLNDQLTKMGLNLQEKKDFLDYWVPEVLSQNTPYYRISFFQTQQLNSLFPMLVEPQPDTVFRIFLDYQPLVSKPTELPQPQKLKKINRVGFTLVEWGGLKLR